MFANARCETHDSLESELIANLFWLEDVDSDARFMPKLELSEREVYILEHLTNMIHIIVERSQKKLNRSYYSQPFSSPCRVHFLFVLIC